MRRILPAALARLAVAAALLAALALLVGCGLKGDLYLPEDTPTQAPAPADVGQDEDDDEGDTGDAA